MCLAVPGRIVESPRRDPDGTPETPATVDFQGTRAEVSLIFTPEAGQGDWVLVHAGFALQVLEERDALETWEYLEQAGAAGLSEEMGQSD